MGQVVNSYIINCTHSVSAFETSYGEHARVTTFFAQNFSRLSVSTPNGVLMYVLQTHRNCPRDSGRIRILSSTGSQVARLWQWGDGVTHQLSLVRHPTNKKTRVTRSIIIIIIIRIRSQLSCHACLLWQYSELSAQHIANCTPMLGRPDCQVNIDPIIGIMTH